jgi:hypothetical protein
MKEFVFIGIAILAAIGAFFLLSKKTGENCIP